MRPENPPTDIDDNPEVTTSPDRRDGDRHHPPSWRHGGAGLTDEW
jgi:hypothetical protein